MFSEELKLEIVTKYLNDGIGLCNLAREYHIDRGSIQKWMKIPLPITSRFRQQEIKFTI